LWSTVFTFTWMPDAFVKAFMMFWIAFFGVGSEAFDPNVTVPEPTAFTSDVGTAPRALAAAVKP
jgi:hypothetical protein